jgi:hypothetical protein
MKKSGESSPVGQLWKPKNFTYPHKFMKLQWEQSLPLSWTWLHLLISLWFDGWWLNKSFNHNSAESKWFGEE